MTGVICYPAIDSRSLDLRIRELGTQAGIVIDDLYVGRTGTQSAFNALEIIGVTPR